MKYLYNYNEIKGAQCIDEFGNKYDFNNLKELANSEDVMKLKVDNDRYLIYPIIRQEWLYNDPERINSFCTTKHEFEKQRIKRELAGLYTDNNYLSKKWDGVVWSGGYEYHKVRNPKRDMPLTSGGDCVWVRFLVLDLTNYFYEFAEVWRANGVVTLLGNGFEFSSFIESVELVDNIQKSGVVFDKNNWYLLNSIPKWDNTISGSSQRIAFKISLNDIFNAHYIYKNTFSTGRKTAKSISFGATYGMSASSLGRSIWR